MGRGFGTTLGSGTTDRIETTYTASHTLNTWLVWAIRNDAGGGGFGRYFDKAHAGDGARALYWDTAADDAINLQFDWTTSRGQWTCPAAAISTLHCIIVTYDAGATTNDPVMFLNGVSQTVTEITAPTGSIETSATPYNIGNRLDGLRNWDGVLYEIAHWDRILSAGEIAACSKGYAANCFPRGLVMYYDLLGRYSPEISISSVTTTGTVTGTAAQPHIPILRPGRLLHPHRTPSARLPHHLMLLGVGI